MLLKQSFTITARVTLLVAVYSPFMGALLSTLFFERCAPWLVI